MSRLLKFSVQRECGMKVIKGYDAVKYGNEFFITCALSGISAEEAHAANFWVVVVRSGMIYLRIDDAIAWHEQTLAATDGKQGDLQILEELRKWREELHIGSAIATGVV